MIFKWLWPPCDILWSCIWCEGKWTEMEHEVRVEWRQIPSLLPAGPHMEPANPFLSALQAGLGVSFCYYPAWQPCLHFLGPSLVSWEGVQQLSFGKCNLQLCWYNRQSPKKHIPLPSPPLQRSSLFPSDGLFEVTTFQLFSGGPCWCLRSLWAQTLCYSEVQTPVRKKLHGQPLCW